MASTTLLSVRSVNDLLYSYGLSSALRSQYVYNPSISEFNDADVWELVRNDAFTHSAISRSTKNCVRPWRIEAYDGSKDKPDKQLAAVVKDGLMHIDRFRARRKRLSEARFVGRTYGAILWQPRKISLGGLPERDWWIPVHIQDVDRRRFHWVVDWDNEANVKKGIHREMYNSNTQQWEILPEELNGSMIEYIHSDTEDRVGYGRGLLEAIYFYHYMKTVTFEKISDGIDRWARGVWIGTIDGLRGASVGKTNEALRQGMQNVLLTMRSEHAAVVDKIDNIKVLETTGTGHQISMDFMHYLDDGIEVLCNGSKRASGVGSGPHGTGAQAETESDTTEAFFQDEREDLDDISTRDLVGSFLRVNYANLEMVKLQKARRPRFTSEQIKKQVPKDAIEVANLMLQHVPLSARQYYEKGEWEQPTDDEERIEPIAAMVPGEGGDRPDFRDVGIKAPGSDKGTGKAFSFPTKKENKEDD